MILGSACHVSRVYAYVTALSLEYDKARDVVCVVHTRCHTACNNWLQDIRDLRVEKKGPRGYDIRLIYSVIISRGLWPLSFILFLVPLSQTWLGWVYIPYTYLPGVLSAVPPAVNIFIKSLIKHSYVDITLGGGRWGLLTLPYLLSLSFYHSTLFQYQVSYPHWGISSI